MIYLLKVLDGKIFRLNLERKDFDISKSKVCKISIVEEDMWGINAEYKID